MMPAVILAGGLATRLRPLTNHIPKSLIEVARRPFIFWQLDLLYQQGVEYVVVCAGYLGEYLKDVLTDYPNRNLKIDTLMDGQHLLGTAGALRQALPHLPSTFFVIYGDCYLEGSMSSVQTHFYQNFPPALITMYENTVKANIKLYPPDIALYDKYHRHAGAQHRDYGMGILSAKVLSDTVSSDLADVYHGLGRKLVGHVMKGRPYEIGSLEGLEQTRKLLSI